MSLPRRLSGYWFFATGALGVQFPYFSLYLKENMGLSASQTGLVLAVPPLVGVVAQPLWGQLADLTGSRTRTLAALALGAAFGYLGLMLPTGFVGMLLATGLMALFSSGLVPTAVSVTMAALSAEGPTGYGRIRVWGTLGFLITVVSSPVLLHAYQDARGIEATPDGPHEPGLGAIFLLGATMLAMASRVAWRLPATPSLTLRAGHGDYRLLLRHGPYLRLMVFIFGAYLLIQGPMVLFPLYVRDRGGDMSDLSHMWIWMLAAEIPLVALAGRAFAKVGPRWMLVSALLAAGLRWTLCAGTRDMTLIYPLQALHAVVIAGLLVGGAMYVDTVVPERLRSTGQAGMNLMGNGLGAILSSSLAGLLLDLWGVDAVYGLCGAGALILGVAGLSLLPRGGGRPFEAQAPGTTPAVGRAR